ncbi:MAG: hypothetical protein ACYDB1_01110 [Acidiferrobacteraceae bacterium]
MIQRYGFGKPPFVPKPWPKGEYVLFSDHIAAIQQLAEALEKYGQHLAGCYADEFTREVDNDGNAETYACTCGLDTALAAVTGDSHD